MELQILHMIQGIRTDWLDSVMIFFSAIGEHGICWIVVSVILAVIPRTRKCGFAMMIAMLLTDLLGNEFLKNAIARPRPCHVDKSVTLLVPCPTSYSFPSGHTANGFTAAVTIMAYYRKPGMVALLVAAIIAFSRMYLFVHYPTDILGGIILGTLDALFVVWCIRMWDKRKAQ